MKFCRIIELSGDNQALVMLDPNKDESWNLNLIFVFDGGRITNGFEYENLEQAQKAFEALEYNDVQNLYYSLEVMFIDEDTRGMGKEKVEKQIIKLNEKLKNV